MDFLRDVALLVVGGSGVLGAAVYLARRYIDRSFDQGIEKFRIQTQAVHDAELERLRTQLQTAAFEHQTRFSRLHERRVEELGKVYSSLVAAHRAFVSWTNPLQLSGEPSMEEKADSAAKLGNKFIEALEEGRIWLPSALCDELDQFARDLRDVNIKFGMEKNPAVGTWKEVSDKMVGEVRSLRRRIEEQARALIDPSLPSPGP